MDDLNEGHEEAVLLADEPEQTARAATWQIAGASVQGTGHQAADLPCQDAHALRLAGDGLIAVVSDGAGSARLAEQGSRAAADFTAERLEFLLAQGVLLSDLDPFALVAEVRAHLEGLAADLETEPRDLACTLLVAALAPNAALFVQIGDGAIVFGDDGLEVACWPDGGEYANETYFVTDAPPGHIHVRREAEAPTRLALLSDGLQRLCLREAERSVHAPFFQAFFAALAGSDDRAAFEQLLSNTLAGPRITGRSDDDLTLVLALRV